jgi:hypothetical protein
MGAGFWPEAETKATRHEPKSGERRPINSISAREIVLLLSQETGLSRQIVRSSRCGSSFSG